MYLVMGTRAPAGEVAKLAILGKERVSHIRTACYGCSVLSVLMDA